MSTHHGGSITLKPISEAAKFQRTLIPARIPGMYALKPIFDGVASGEDIRNGVIAFRDFLYLFCDRLIADGHLYAKPPAKPKSMNDYPFLHNMTNLLVDIGYYGKLSENGDSLLVTELPSCTAFIDEKGKKKAPKIPFSAQDECIRFLTLCGFAFSNADAPLTEVSYPSAPLLLTGLKALSVADMELRTGRRYWNDNNLLRCDYRLMKADDTDILDLLKDFLHPLPEDLQAFALRLHRRSVELGLTCIMTILGDVSFAYVPIKRGRKVSSTRDIYARRVWEFSNSLKNGYCIFVRAKKTDQYADVIAEFPAPLQETIAKGYGCDRKLRNERCQHGCQGIRIPLDGAILDIGRHIERWLDNEASR